MECAINDMLFRLKIRYCMFQHDFIEFRFIRRLIQIMNASSGPSRPTSALASAQCPRLTTNVVRQRIHSWKQWIRKGIPFCTWVIAGRSLMPLTLMAGQTTWVKKSSPIYWRRKRIRNPWKPRHWTGPSGSRIIYIKVTVGMIWPDQSYASIRTYRVGAFIVSYLSQDFMSM